MATTCQIEQYCFIVTLYFFIYIWVYHFHSALESTAKQQALGYQQQAFGYILENKKIALLVPYTLLSRTL